MIAWKACRPASRQLSCIQARDLSFCKGPIETAIRPRLQLKQTSEGLFAWDITSVEFHLPFISLVGRASVWLARGRGFKPPPDKQPGSLKLVRSYWQWFDTLAQFRWSRYWAATLSRWPFLHHPSFISQIEGYVKEPTLLLKTIKDSFPGGVVHLSRITHHVSRIRHQASRITHHSYHGLWEGYSKLINGLIAAATGAPVCWSPSLLLDMLI